MATRRQLCRREFLKTSAQTAGAFVLGFHLPASMKAQQWSPGEARKVFKPNAWLRITTDNQVTVLVEKPELGKARALIRP